MVHISIRILFFLHLKSVVGRFLLDIIRIHESGWTGSTDSVKSDNNSDKWILKQQQEILSIINMESSGLLMDQVTSLIWFPMEQQMGIRDIG